MAAHVLRDSSEAKQVAIWGGDDLEVNYSGGGALAWAHGYSETTPSPYLDYGAAEGCPASTHTNGTCTGGESGWDQQVEYELSWSITDAHSAPEIYYNRAPTMRPRDLPRRRRARCNRDGCACSERRNTELLRPVPLGRTSTHRRKARRT